MSFIRGSFGSTTAVRVRRGATFESVEYWLVTRFADSIRCDFDRIVRPALTNFLATAREAPRKTKTLVPPVMSLTGTISCAAARPAQTVATTARPNVFGLLFDPLKLLILNLNYFAYQFRTTNARLQCVQ